MFISVLYHKSVRGVTSMWLCRDIFVIITQDIDSEIPIKMNTSFAIHAYVLINFNPESLNYKYNCRTYNRIQANIKGSINICLNINY